MHDRLLLAAVAASTVVSCAEIECTVENDIPVCDGDDRPSTLEYVTSTILRPSCANAQCHSSFSAVFEYRFDTVEHAQESIIKLNNPDDPLDDELLVVPGDPDASLLYLVLVRDTADDGTFPRMPYDQPLANPDIALVRRWIEEGADGLVVP